MHSYKDIHVLYCYRYCNCFNISMQMIQSFWNCLIFITFQWKKTGFFCNLMPFDSCMNVSWHFVLFSKVTMSFVRTQMYIMEESLQLVILSFTIEIKTSDTCWVFVSCFWISFCVAIPHRIGYDKLIHVQHSAIFKFIYNTVTGIVNFSVMFGKYELQGNVSKL